MSEILKAYATVAADVKAAADAAGRKSQDVRLVAVSKTHEAETIRPVLSAGHRLFGENRVQEAAAKWPGLRKEFAGIELHLIGPLQSNKAAEAVAFFDVIETIDRDKIAKAIAAEIGKQGRSPKLFVQVNIGEEPQKAGIAPAELDAFLARCRDHYGLSVAGLMCIPPVEAPPRSFFDRLQGMADRHKLAERSMGMSADYREAIAAGATLIRVGSAIFGARR
jgi:PLP dependent protein